MTEREFIEAAQEKMKQGRAPILYLHPDERSGASMVLVDMKVWKEISEQIPESPEITDLFMYHSHLEPEGDQ